MFAGFLSLMAWNRDRKQVIGKVDQQNAYHKALRIYLDQYLIKNEINIQPRFLKNTLLLAHKGEGVDSYEGILQNYILISSS